MTVAREFIDRQLGAIRKEFFAGKTDREFYQERNMLEQAICYPAKWLNSKGSTTMNADRYGAILATVFRTIRQHGRVRKIERFSAYLLHSVQEHMAHHGEEYYYAAKELRSVVRDVARQIRHGEPAGELVPVLAEVYQTLRAGQRGGRKRKSALTATQRQPELL